MIVRGKMLYNENDEPPFETRIEIRRCDADLDDGLPSKLDGKVHGHEAC